MHTAILQKAVDELKKESPRLDYICGLLETLIEISPKPPQLVFPVAQPSTIKSPIKLGPLGPIQEPPKENATP